MSYSTVLGVTPDERPVGIAELRNSHGWASSIWKRLLRAHGLKESWIIDDAGLDQLWRDIEKLPEYQQAALVLTFDTGVIPSSAFEWAATQLDEFDKLLPADPGTVNHVPAVADLLRSKPDFPFVGIWCTSVTENPFDGDWDEENDEPGNGIPLSDLYILERHRV